MSDDAHVMDASDGAVCACGRPSAHESGWCGVQEGCTCHVSPTFLQSIDEARAWLRKRGASLDIATALEALREDE